MCSVGLYHSVKKRLNSQRSETGVEIMVINENEDEVLRGVIVINKNSILKTKSIIYQDYWKHSCTMVDAGLKL